MTPTLIQTKFLKRYIATPEREVPIAGPFAMVSVCSDWFETVTVNPLVLRITPAGVKAFWRGVKTHGAKAVMGKLNTPNNPTQPPPVGGSPVFVAA